MVGIFTLKTSLYDAGVDGGGGPASAGGTGAH